MISRSLALACLSLISRMTSAFVVHPSRFLPARHRSRAADTAGARVHLCGSALSPGRRCYRRRLDGTPLQRAGAKDSEDDDDMSFGERALRDRTNAELQEMVSSHSILAFIKGTQLMPQCGYSGTLVNILQSLSVPFETVDVLADERIRQGIKEFSDWPTIPQLYLGGEFVGGTDIVIELFQSGELQEMIEVAAAS